MHCKQSPGITLLFLIVLSTSAFGQRGKKDFQSEINQKTTSIEPKVISWYEDIHQNPELSNREFRTAMLAAKHLERLDIEVTTGIAHTGVVGILKGGLPGPVIAIRADMDALPVVEEVDLPFASKVRTTYNDQEVGVMHACGHDAHVACLMGAAEVLAGMRKQLRGTILFIFQPAEEGAPAGEEGGAELMMQEGIFKDLQPEAVFALHTDGRFDAGTLGVRPYGMCAGADQLEIIVKGKQSHGAFPWLGNDPIVVASQIVIGLQVIPSRQLDMTKALSLVTIGSIQGGVRGNIIPNEVRMLGTIRTFDTEIREDFHRRIRQTAQSIAEGSGATAEVIISGSNPVTFNDPELLTKMTPTLLKVTGEGNLITPSVEMGAEDFPFLTQNAKGLYFYLGVRTPGKEIESQHSPTYYVDESSLQLGVRALSSLAVDYLNGK
ncbi:MAG: amidohydrolase [Imperialibacter sp.]|uniref:amidohydrolase n=1 Tax=Imperialibacter sp. TaxID=2038411 RepID=UPI003A88B79A